MQRLVFIAGIILTCTPLLVIADDTELPTPREPDRSVTLPVSGDEEVGEALVSEDGKTAYVETTKFALLVWPTLVGLWPEWGGGLVALACVLAMVRFMRARRRPMAAGEPHCRKCNYQLTGIDSRRCPECGADITRRRVTGRTVWQRCRRHVGVAGVLAVTYAALWIGGVERTNPVSDWFIWPSSTLLEWVDDPAYEDRLVDEVVGRIFEIDLETGQVQRALTRYRPSIVASMRFESDGTQIVIESDGFPASDYGYFERLGWDRRNGSTQSVSRYSTSIDDDVRTFAMTTDVDTFFFVNFNEQISRRTSGQAKAKPLYTLPRGLQPGGYGSMRVLPEGQRLLLAFNQQFMLLGARAWHYFVVDAETGQLSGRYSDTSACLLSQVLIDDRHKRLFALTGTLEDGRPARRVSWHRWDESKLAGHFDLPAGWTPVSMALDFDGQRLAIGMYADKEAVGAARFVNPPPPPLWMYVYGLDGKLIERFPLPDKGWRAPVFFVDGGRTLVVVQGLDGSQARFLFYKLKP